MTEALLRMPDGRPLGPTATPQGWTVVIKQSSTKDPVPLSLVATQIRSTMIRERLDEEELKLARAWVAKFEVHDSIPYEKLGLPASLQKPWTKSLP